MRSWLNQYAPSRERVSARPGFELDHGISGHNICRYPDVMSARRAV